MPPVTLTGRLTLTPYCLARGPEAHAPRGGGRAGRDPVDERRQGRAELVESTRPERPMLRDGGAAGRV